MTLENSLKESVVKAEDFIDFAIQYPIITKTEIFPVNPLAKLELESARFDIVENLKLAIKIIENEVRFTQLIPEVRTNIAMTIPNVKSTDYIATTEGRITVVNGYPKAIGRIHFGGIHHVPRLILSAQKFDPLITAAMNIRFSPKIFRACQKTGLSIIKIDRTKEPKDKAEIEGKSMSWIIEEAAKLNDGKIPDLIADEGALGKEAMIRLFGHSATEVVDKAFQILKYLE